MSNAASPIASVNELAVFRKVALRLLPFLFLLYVINLIDRTNIGIAALQMVDKPTEPGKEEVIRRHRILSEQAYALGSGIFYVGYLIFEVPSNLILLRMGARAWIARILVSWGVVSSAMMFVTGPVSFAILRVLLGIAEAGFFPGIIFYLTDWFPARVRARAIAQFMLGGVVASMLGNPLSGLILQGMDNVAGLWGWQWVFLLEGLPAVILGFVTLRVLPDRPPQAGWLTPDERAWLAAEVQRERDLHAGSHRHCLAAAFTDPRVWLLIAVYFTVAVGDNSYGFYIPRFLESQFTDWTPFQIGLLAAAPSVIAMACMVLVGRHSDRTGERRWHVACSAFAAAAGWLTIALATSDWLTSQGDFRWLFLLGIALALSGMKSMLPTFWTLPPLFLTGAAAAGGIALINSVANLGGLFGPMMIGIVKSGTDDFTLGYAILAGTLFVGGVLVLAVARSTGTPDERAGRDGRHTPTPVTR